MYMQGPQGRTTEVYGIWQTQPWAPPTAKNGIVPRNDYGNVEVPPLTSILPLGTVHIEIPQAAAAAAQLEVDAAPALVGFEAGRQGKMVAQFRGVVVCIDYEEAVREAANAILDAQRQQAQERRCGNGYCRRVGGGKTNLALQILCVPPPMNLVVASEGRRAVFNRALCSFQQSCGLFVISS